MIWSANRNRSISKSDQLQLTSHGLTIVDQSSNVTVWSTPKLGSNSKVSVMQLLDSGNLVLLDEDNISLWQSFDYPTDTIVVGQRLAVGKSLVGDVKDGNLSVGEHSLVVTSGDAILQWNQMTYWKLSMETMAFKDSSGAVSFLGLNGTGLYLYGDDGSTVVFQVILQETENFRIAKLGYDGKFVVTRLVNNSQTEEFTMPADNCKIPSFCGKYGLCNNGVCSCLSGFRTNKDSDCVPTDSSITMPNACIPGQNQTESNSSISYLTLGQGVDYFSNNYMESVKYGANLSLCQDLCSKNCSCLGVFYDSGSSSCLFIQNDVGSFIQSSEDSDPDRSGYIKAEIQSSPQSSADDQTNFPEIGVILIPVFGLILILAGSIVAYYYWRKQMISKMRSVKLGSRNSSEDEFEMFSIAGLPVRFNYETLSAATDNFKNQIGKGGFGTVYKGILPDKTVVAVKKITNIGVQGNSEFCTEIAIIGKIHHINLVKLKGFCALGRQQRFLVLEFMDRGSLDQALFSNGPGPVLEWRERFDIALGTARGLAYLHSGCEHKIIHCDIKPENILLHHNLQVKLSDFGLSKLLTPEQSSLFTTMRGTRGYLAPEWLTNSSITDKTDVYSYGMVLLEIVRGSRNCASETERQQNVETGDVSMRSSRQEPSSRWNSRLVYFPLVALEMHEQRRYMELADPRLQGRAPISEVEKVVRIALCCIHQEPGMRPTMSNVVSMLEGGMALTEPILEQLHHLRFYGQRFSEASTIDESGEQMRNKFSLFSPGTGKGVGTISSLRKQLHKNGMQLPLPPSNANQNSSFKLNELVDAYKLLGWWVGEIDEILTVMEMARYTVFGSTILKNIVFTLHLQNSDPISIGLMENGLDHKRYLKPLEKALSPIVAAGNKADMRGQSSTNSRTSLLEKATSVYGHSNQETI
ncbi:G-type lectin S-receptor-like serine/threonine-protein kinase At5g35370 [Rutidosis leptorrhynchoides]|uniref:G-type lectin S-receptor-like serine/threonine-protein kinase At5g35370 n=1 Tax=Rutidosis leptorrhynchoides TaxID=125765 RepID=UPI003A996286